MTKAQAHALVMYLEAWRQELDTVAAVNFARRQGGFSDDLKRSYELVVQRRIAARERFVEVCDE